MAEKNLTENLTPTADYISHHLTNLTYGWCEKSQTWGFAYHQQNIFKETSCKVSEMGFWSFHLDTIFMSTFLGLIFFGFFVDSIEKSVDFAEKNMEGYRVRALQILKDLPESPYRKSLELMVNYVIERTI